MVLHGVELPGALQNGGGFQGFVSAAGAEQDGDTRGASPLRRRDHDHLRLHHRPKDQRPFRSLFVSCELGLDLTRSDALGPQRDDRAVIPAEGLDEQLIAVLLGEERPGNDQGCPLPEDSVVSMLLLGTNPSDSFSGLPSTWPSHSVPAMGHWP